MKKNRGESNTANRLDFKSNLAYFGGYFEK